MDEPKYGIGDKVKIIKYGHPIWVNKSENYKSSLPIIEEDAVSIVYDIEAGLVGQDGLVVSVSGVSPVFKYSLSGIKGKGAWYNEEQLELINKNPNR